MNFESCKRGRTGYFHFLVSWFLNFLLFLRSSEDLSQILGQAKGHPALRRAPLQVAGVTSQCCGRRIGRRPQTSFGNSLRNRYCYFVRAGARVRLTHLIGEITAQVSEDVFGLAVICRFPNNDAVSRDADFATIGRAPF